VTPELPPIRTDIDAAKADLREFGLTRYRGAAATEEVDEARERLLSQAAGEVAHGCAFREWGNDFQPDDAGPNQRVLNLVNKGEAFRRLLLNPVALRLARHLLGRDIQLFSTTANIAVKGGARQPLHGDQLFAPVETPYPLLVNCVWMLDEFVEANGATRVVPGSHTAGRWPGPDESVEAPAATGERGVLMVFDGRLWHGAGGNITDAPRHALLTAYCRPFLRPQENSTLSVSPEVLAKCSPELLALLGLRSWASLGSVDGLDPGLARPATYSKELYPPETVA
jgi:hypothetical protein